MGQNFLVQLWQHLLHPPRDPSGERLATPIPWDRAWRLLIAVSPVAALAVALHNPGAGTVGAICAMLTSFNDPGGGLRRRVVTLVATTLGIIAGGVLGGLVGPSHWAVLPCLFVCGFVVGRVHGTSQLTENAARFAAISVVVAASLKLEDPQLLVVALAGGGWAALVVVLDFALRRVNPPDVSHGWTVALSRLRAGLNAGWRFALCYAATATVGLLVAEDLGVRRAGWVTVTVLLVMRPDGAESLRLALDRVAGTLLGVAVAAGIELATTNAWVLIGCTVLLAFSQPSGAAWKRWLGIAAATALVLVLLHLAALGQGGARTLLTARLYDTLIGCALAVLGTLLAFPEIWPRASDPAAR